MEQEELIHIIDYDENWPDDFRAERKNLARVLKIPEASIEHIGSTAVPGMVSKPIIDIMAGLSVVPPSNDFKARLLGLEYEFLGESGVPDRYYFRRRNDTSFNLHVVSVDGAHWKSNLALRDYLRVNADEQLRYTVAKRQALATGNTTLSTYSDAKASIVSDLLAKALRWHHG